MAGATATAARPSNVKSGPTTAASREAFLDAAPIVLPITSVAAQWRPMFELNSFKWPAMVEAILAAVPGQLMAAAGELAEAARRHRKLVAVAGATSGDGVTSLTLALARTLLEQQQRVVLVDAHFAAPRLAESLGVTPQAAWDENLSGEKPLAETLIDSLNDRVTLLPLREPALPDWRPREARLKSTFDELRRHYDIVLVDAGPLGDGQDRQQLLSWAEPCRVDRALVVLDARVGSPEWMNDVESRLQGCGIAQWNFIENFFAA
jgi:Mrp family chromosome partitioning ATPase